MNIFGGLLFLQGHITNVALARQLVAAAEAPHEGADGPGEVPGADRSIPCAEERGRSAPPAAGSAPATHGVPLRGDAVR